MSVTQLHGNKIVIGDRYMAIDSNLVLVKWLKIFRISIRETLRKRDLGEVSALRTVASLAFGSTSCG